MSETAELLDTELGQWRVVTESSTYRFDMGARTAARYRAAGTGPVEEGLAPAADLRLDGAAVRLRRVLTCRVGEELTVVLDIRGDGVSTVRRSTIVRSIRLVGLS